MIEDEFIFKGQFRESRKTEMFGIDFDFYQDTIASVYVSVTLAGVGAGGE